MKVDIFGVAKLREFLTAANAKGLVRQCCDVDLDAAVGPDLDDILSLRERLITEEVDELIVALEDEPKAQVLKELCDVLYVVIGTAVTFGLDKHLTEAFNRVHANNMAKIAMGTVNADGKLVKPLDHPKVNLEDLV